MGVKPKTALIMFLIWLALMGLLAYLWSLISALRVTAALSVIALLAVLFTMGAVAFGCRWSWSKVSIGNCSAAIDNASPDRISDTSASDNKDLSQVLLDDSAMHRQLVKYAVDVMCLLDSDGTIRWISPACKTVWGYETNRLVGSKLEMLLIADDNNASPVNAILDAQGSLDMITTENRLKRSDGRSVHLSWSAHWSAAENGLFCIARDNTARVRAETLLRESEERTRLILENLPVAVLLTGTQGYIEMINRTAEMTLGYGQAAAAGKHLATILPETVEQYSGQDLLSQLKSFSSEATFATTSGGARFPVEVLITPLNVQGETKFLVMMLDLSDRYQADLMKRQFVAMISHDIKAPLSSVRTLMELFSEGQSNEKLAELAAKAVKQIDRVTNLTGDLMDLEKIDSPEFALHLTEVSLKSVVQDAQDALSKMAADHGVQLVFPDTDLLCRGDHARLVQVMVNLLSNAIKFSPRGDTVTVVFEQTDHTVRVHVEDHGRGVSQEKRESIFDRFKQASAEDANRGTGLGLAICKALIERQGGHIGVSVGPEAGSIFWFTLPEKEPES
jgi:PAS domain S-box-containing protein